MSSREGKQTTQLVDYELQVNVHCLVPGFTIPFPDSVNKKVNASNTILNWGGVKIAKISPTVVVKFGSHVTLSEAKSMMSVEQNTETVPVPKVFACYSYGPIHRDNYGSLFDTYIFMSLLNGYLSELRKIGNSNYIGSVDLGPVTDPILESHPIQGPFETEEANVLAGMLSQNRHQILFTHGDLRLQNIMIKDGCVSGILDWKFSGWYPEYWEFSKALHVWKWQNDWTEYLVQILQPYYSEYAVHSFLTETLW
ncbi:hypothetical protein ASPWEDRAFT_54700 [Aspergillus wentii DTO 134E9]|uniref:Aminoglycoside phosphotransferase domain-containing protein n=1 Tax=Aspergillus wentii DTO 134E9 TaxID=1073089 RepID=A0A1L9R9J8_ASPWE|nr:uncharacterized protein ASPWEDRAFT_54700 [Aspergillus wentii DTO 134E9]OJJ31579.1 hypothetical protein ASPWEDRAFT_54700 [Aspergillus wentii DTO 134E9]